MSYVPVDVPAFGGLDLRDPEDATGSPDCLNVYSPRPGVLSKRPGLSQSGSTNLGTSPTGITLFTHAGVDPPIFIVGYDGALRAYNGTTGAALAASYTTPATNIWSFANIGGYVWCTGVNYTSFYDGTVTYADRMYRASLTGYRFGTITAVTFSQPTISTKASGESSFTTGRNAPYATCAAVQPIDNRLAVQALGAWGVAGAASDSTVVFSQPDNSYEFDESDYVKLDEADGERITAMAAWGDYLFVFKRTKVFVFYGNSTDSTGGAVFNYRTFRGLDDGGEIFPGQVIVATNGIYFVNKRGVWFTSGQRPVSVSENIDWLFTGDAQAAGRFVQPQPAGQGFAAKGYVFIPVTVSSSSTTSYNRWLVLRDGEWWLWSFGEYVRAGAYGYVNAQFPRSNAEGVNKLSLDDTVTTTTDSGTAFSSYYTSPYMHFGSPGVEKTIRQTELRGSGTLDFSWGVNQQSHGIPASVTMLSNRGWDRTAVRGESFSWKVANSASGAWKLHGVTPYLRERRRTGVKT